MEENKSIGASLGEGLFRSFILTMILLIILSIILTLASLSDKVANVATSVLTMVSIVYGAAYSAKKAKRKGWVLGILTALTYMIIIYIVAVLRGRGFALEGKDFVRIAFALAIGTLSGMLGINLQ